MALNCGSAYQKCRVSQILFQNNHIERVIGRNQAAGTGCSPLACLRSSSRLILSSSVNASAHRMLETKIRDVLASRILETARETDGSNDAKAGSENVWDSFSMQIRGEERRER